MNPLHLSPLPVLRGEEESGSRVIEREGFVDEAAVAALVHGVPTGTRPMPDPEDLALAADDLDFAGWRLSPVPQARLIESFPQSDEPIRRPAPPEFEQAGLGVPYSGGHRWWIAGLAGVLSTMLFSVLLLNLSLRSGTRLEVFFAPRPAAASQQPALEKNPPVEASTELTNVINSRP